MYTAVHWKPIEREGDPLWAHNRCLYAYLSKGGREILYVGKTWDGSVRTRWRRSGKPHFWDDLEQLRGIRGHRVFVGAIELSPGNRLTRELLSDIETLLIAEIGPWGNISAQESRISRPGLKVCCRGR